MKKNLNKKEEIIKSLEQIRSKVDDLNGTTLINLVDEVANIHNQLTEVIENIDDIW